MHAIEFTAYFILTNLRRAHSPQSLNERIFDLLTFVLKVAIFVMFFIVETDELWLS